VLTATNRRIVHIRSGKSRTDHVLESSCCVLICFDVCCSLSFPLAAPWRVAAPTSIAILNLQAKLVPLGALPELPLLPEQPRASRRLRAVPVTTVKTAETTAPIRETSTQAKAAREPRRVTKVAHPRCRMAAAVPVAAAPVVAEQVAAAPVVATMGEAAPVVAAVAAAECPT